MTRADGPPQPSSATQLDRISAELADQFHGVFSMVTVRRYVHETYTLLERQASVRHYLPTLTARFAKQRLTDLGHARGIRTATVPQVLFICVHNVGRSQLAAALLDHHAFGKVSVRSAGSRPRGDIPAGIIASLAELGVELTEAYPKPLTDEVVHAADVVVTMGCGDACPVYPGKRYLDWQVDDPASAAPEEIRRIRDDIDRHVRVLLSDLLGD